MEEKKKNKKSHAQVLRNLDEYNGQNVTRSSAIRLKCLDCCGNQRNEVRACGAVNCPLWPYRFGTGWHDPKIHPNF